MPKPFCLVCGSDRYLAHHAGCEAWVIAVDLGIPDGVGDAAADEAHVPQPAPVPRRRR